MFSYFYSDKGSLRWGNLIKIEKTENETVYVFASKQDNKIYRVKEANLFYDNNKRGSWELIDSNKDHSQR